MLDRRQLQEFNRPGHREQSPHLRVFDLSYSSRMMSELKPLLIGAGL